jgi:hypothetical protein
MMWRGSVSFMLAAVVFVAAPCAAARPDQMWILRISRLGAATPSYPGV